LSAVQKFVRPWLLSCLALVVLATAQVALAHQRLDTAGQVNRLQRDVRQIEDEINRLNIELTMLTRPEQLRTVALEQLGMRPPTAMQVIKQ